MKFYTVNVCWCNSDDCFPTVTGFWQAQYIELMIVHFVIGSTNLLFAASRSCFCKSTNGFAIKCMIHDLLQTGLPHWFLVYWLLVRMDCFQIHAMIHRSSSKLFILVTIEQLITTSIKNTVAKIHKNPKFEWPITNSIPFLCAISSTWNGVVSFHITYYYTTQLQVSWLALT